MSVRPTVPADVPAPRSPPRPPRGPAPYSADVDFDAGRDAWRASKVMAGDLGFGYRCGLPSATPCAGQPIAQTWPVDGPAGSSDVVRRGWGPCRVHAKLLLRAESRRVARGQSRIAPTAPFRDMGIGLDPETGRPRAPDVGTAPAADDLDAEAESRARDWFERAWAWHQGLASPSAPDSAPNSVSAQAHGGQPRRRQSTRPSTSPWASDTQPTRRWTPGQADPRFDYEWDAGTGGG